MNDFNIEKLRIENDHKFIDETVKHADKIITTADEKSNSNIFGTQSIDLSSASLLEVDKVVVDKLVTQETSLHDTMFDMVMEYDKKEQVLTKKAGSVVSSILITVIIISLGVIAAIICIK